MTLSTLEQLVTHYVDHVKPVDDLTALEWQILRKHKVQNYPFVLVIGGHPGVFSFKTMRAPGFTSGSFVLEHLDRSEPLRPFPCRTIRVIISNDVMLWDLKNCKIRPNGADGLAIQPEHFTRARV